MGALKEAARKGEGGDTRLIHASNGDVVIPREILSKPGKELIDLMLSRHGLEPGRFQVGHPQNRKNKKTRLPMYDAGDGSGDSSGGSGNAEGSGVGGASAPGSAGPAGDMSGGMGDTGGAPQGPTSTGTETTTGPSMGLTGFGPADSLLNSIGIGATANKLGENSISVDPGQMATAGINTAIGFTPAGPINTAIGAANMIGGPSGLGLFSHDIPTIGSGLVGLGRSIGHGIEGAIGGGGGMVGSGGGQNSVGMGTAGTPAAPGPGDLSGLGGDIGTSFNDELRKQLMAA